MTLLKIRKAYEQNYKDMLAIIDKMGGDKQIKYHRRRNTTLFRQLKNLQKTEHRLDTMESRWHHEYSDLSI
jgi:hypothetical protein